MYFSREVGKGKQKYRPFGRQHVSFFPSKIRVLYDKCDLSLPTGLSRRIFPREGLKVSPCPNDGPNTKFQQNKKQHQNKKQLAKLRVRPLTLPNPLPDWLNPMKDHGKYNEEHSKKSCSVTSSPLCSDFA